ncbi:hypothetical protein FACS1894217_12550 [Clostridia bacterium]|nr:hypothetical protein FACS1894217_12550 [Clostridia bacterium]
MILPNVGKAFIPIEKLEKYALNPFNDPNKAIAFESALGYTKDNAQALADNISANLGKFQAVSKGDKGFGQQYQVVLNITGANGKAANVLTGWIIDSKTNAPRLTTLHVTRKKVGQ